MVQHRRTAKPRPANGDDFADRSNADQNATEPKETAAKAPIPPLSSFIGEAMKQIVLAAMAGLLLAGSAQADELIVRTGYRHHHYRHHHPVIIYRDYRPWHHWHHGRHWHHGWYWQHHGWYWRHHHRPYRAFHHRYYWGY
jgi:hypothetical protein